MSTLVLPQSMVADREAGIKANAQHVDDNFDALASAVNGKLDLDGSSTPTADIPMGNHKLTNVASPTLSGDAATKGYVDNADTSLSNTISTLDGAVVKLAGSQTITGSKTFNSTITRSDALNGGGTIGLQTIDTNNKGDTKQISYYTGGVVYNRIWAKNNTANKNLYLDIQTRDDGTGRVYIGGDANWDSTTLGSVIASNGISKTTSGYCKLSNGLIVQWGMNGPQNNNSTWNVSFPTAFTAAPECVQVCFAANGNAYVPRVTNTSTTGFVAKSDVMAAASVLSTYLRWIAIGY